MGLRRSKNRKKAERKAWMYFSEWVRRGAADHRGLLRCFTCGAWHHWKKVDAGHFMSRRYEATKYDEKNVKPQCVSCNKYHKGRQYIFGQNLDKLYGDGTAAEIERKSKMKCHRKQDDYERIAEKYYNKLKKLDSPL